MRHSKDVDPLIYLDAARVCRAVELYASPFYALLTEDIIPSYCIIAIWTADRRGKWHR